MNNAHSLLGTIDPMGRHDNPGHNNPPSSNPHGNPHNNSNSGPVSLYDLRHGTKNALGVSEHSVRCILNIENWIFQYSTATGICGLWDHFLAY